MVAAAIGAAAVVGVAGSAMSASAAGNAAQTSADAQTAANQNTVAEQQREFDRIQQILSPYNQAGTQALGSYGNLLGTNGQAAQSQAIQQIQQSPLYQSTMKSGTNAILQNASATGGLRGGNTQLSLGNLGTQTLSNLVQQQQAGFGNLVNVGLGAATQTGNFGAQSANSIASANTALGQGLANTYGLQGQQTISAINNGTNAITGSLGTYSGLKAGGYF